MIAADPTTVMARYLLFAARDGEVLLDRADHDSDAAARTWSALKIADRFQISPREAGSFEELIADCDGVLLERETVPPADPVDHSPALSG